MKSKKFIQALINLLYPPRCIFCDSIMDYHAETHVCEQCKPIVPALPRDRCTLCLAPLDPYCADTVCNTCRTRERQYDMVCAPFAYQPPVNSAILRLKNARCYDYASTMADIMCGELVMSGQSEHINLVIPVPISKQRMAARQYNQSALLAKEIAKRLSVEYCDTALKKHRHTPPQHTLTAAKRRVNLIGAFSISDDSLVSHKRVLLVDDVITTGTTLNECSRVLKEAGAAYISCVTFASTLLTVQPTVPQTSTQPTPKLDELISLSK